MTIAISGAYNGSTWSISLEDLVGPWQIELGLGPILLTVFPVGCSWDRDACFEPVSGATEGHCTVLLYQFCFSHRQIRPYVQSWGERFELGASFSYLVEHWTCALHRACIHCHIARTIVLGLLFPGIRFSDSHSQCHKVLQFGQPPWVMEVVSDGTRSSSRGQRHALLWHAYHPPTQLTQLLLLNHGVSDHHCRVPNNYIGGSGVVTCSVGLACYDNNGHSQTFLFPSDSCRPKDMRAFKNRI